MHVCLYACACVCVYVCVCVCERVTVIQSQSSQRGYTNCEDSSDGGSDDVLAVSSAAAAPAAANRIRNDQEGVRITEEQHEGGW